MSGAPVRGRSCTVSPAEACVPWRRRPNWLTRLVANHSGAPAATNCAVAASSGTATLPIRRPVTALSCCGHVVERDRGGTGQLQLRRDGTGQGDGRDFGDVPRIDHRDLGARARDEERPGLPHAVRGGQQVRHHEGGLEQDVIDLARPEVLLDPAVRVGERDGRPDRGVDRGQLDDAPHARGDRGVDQRDLPGDLLRMVGAGQVHRVDAVDGGGQRGRIGEVADGQADVGAEQVAARSRSRTSARTVTPRRRSWGTRWRPTVPVAPMRRMVI